LRCARHPHAIIVDQAERQAAGRSSRSRRLGHQYVAGLQIAVRQIGLPQLVGQAQPDVGQAGEHSRLVGVLLIALTATFLTPTASIAQDYHHRYWDHRGENYGGDYYGTYYGRPWYGTYGGYYSPSFYQTVPRYAYGNFQTYSRSYYPRSYAPFYNGYYP
jgi:hypothetical protein